MADPFVAEIRIFPFNFPPRGWAWCDGQIIPISQNTALFSLLGTTYGGDGRSTFALPDLKGRSPMFYGQGPGLSLYDQGEVGGSETVSLLTSEMPAHTHTMRANDGDGSIPIPTGNVAAGPGADRNLFLYRDGPPNAFMSPTAVTNAGGNQPHNNMQPYLTFYFCIALQGVFPPRP